MKPSPQCSPACTSTHDHGRRRALAIGRDWLIASVPLLSPGVATLVYAQPPSQGDWRYCHKCHAMFFSGFPAKGVCKAGGAHEAMGFNFVLPHDVPETGTAQSKWRFCQKCNGMFFDGFPGKGICAAGGPHVPAGYVFTLPHSAPESPTAQASWRFCQKCMLMFFDGFPDKGVCGAGGGHQAAGLTFVLAHTTNYPVKVQNLALQAPRLQQMVNVMWDNAGRALVASTMERVLKNRGVAPGVNIRTPHASIGAVNASARQIGPNLFAVDLEAPGNNILFKTTTPTVLGSYADPEFRVGFRMTLRFEMMVRNALPPVAVTVIEARVHDASIAGANAVGTIVETVGDFVTGGGFSRDITQQINTNGDVRVGLGQAISAALDKVG
ncbi:hypothetical protein IP91_00560 [Pseudoduganella lurida]|uniref:Uncharacterized protein n=1 Tax=Pseudoduganella lurida TaxID=1036180 RepID=A0A562RKF2_9BURK|nr:hypothetical protein [Pseudoduganella lurida]TWI69491.1 hypothetical protein IP91_00560 [Pseudoduganella lurida]